MKARWKARHRSAQVLPTTLPKTWSMPPSLKAFAETGVVPTIGRHPVTDKRKDQLERLYRAALFTLRDEPGGEIEELLRDLGFTSKVEIRESDESSGGRKLQLVRFEKQVEWSVYYFLKAALLDEGEQWQNARFPLAFLKRKVRSSVRDSRLHPGKFGQRLVKRQDRFEEENILQLPVRPDDGESADDSFANDAEYVGSAFSTRSDASHTMPGGSSRGMLASDYDPEFVGYQSGLREGDLDNIDFERVIRDADIDDEVAAYIRNRAKGIRKEPAPAVKKRFQRLCGKLQEVILQRVREQEEFWHKPENWGRIEKWRGQSPVWLRPDMTPEEIEAIVKSRSIYFFPTEE